VTPAELSAALTAVVSAAVDAGELAVPVPATVAVERPKQREHGDYATNIALVLAKPAGKPPRAVAELLADRIGDLPAIERVDIAGPGFLNITLAQGSAAELAGVIVAAGPAYGRGDKLAGTRVNMEFISANPTGPLHLGHTRWAAVGDAIARVLEAAGAEVTREFYINDRGVQMDRFGASLMAAANGREVPADGYHGDYIADLAKQVVAATPGILELSVGEQLVAFREEGYGLQLADQRRVLDGFRTHFDVWSSERALYDSGAVERGLERLREQGHVFEADGAVWLRTTDFGDDKDRVLVKADGELTYFTADTAYYVDKRARGFDLCIYLLGADHHGYVNRLRAVAACAGDSDDNISVLIGQLVQILKAGAEVRLSKRAGTIVTLEDFVEMAGVDAVRYTLNRYPTDSPLTLDIDVITRQTNENPVFYVQYAHARIASLLRNAGELGTTRGDSYDASLLSHERENDLLLALAQYPGVVAGAADLREPHRIARYLEELAGTYHRFYDACRVLPQGDDEATDLNRARLWLVDATRVVLANGLDLLGVSAPERM
jgi:arginyl-tRNA synthetase